MTFTYRFRDTAETMAARIAAEDRTPMVVFTAVSSGEPATCICPLGEFGEPEQLIAIYDPAA